MADAMAPEQPHTARRRAQGGMHGSHLLQSTGRQAGRLTLPSCSAQFGLLHVKAVDDAGHDRNLAYRCAYLRAADALLRQLAARLWAHEVRSGGAVRYALCVTGDHSTPVLFGDHSNEPVPFAVAHLADLVSALGGAAAVAATPLTPIATPEFAGADGARAPARLPSPPREAREAPRRAVAGDGVAAFDELAVAAGGLGRFCGAAVMPLLKAFAATAPETQP